VAAAARGPVGRGFSEGGKPCTISQVQRQFANAGGALVCENLRFDEADMGNVKCNLGRVRDARRIWGSGLFGRAIGT
jgi:hypothetical protein